MEVRKTILVTSLVFVLTAWLLVVFLIIPLLKQIRFSSQDLSRARSDLILLEQRQEEVMGFERAYLDSIRPQVQRLEEGFIHPEVPLAFVEFLESEARQSNLTVKISLISQPKEKPESLSSLIFQVSLEGILPDILRFVDRLEASSYFIEIQNFQARKLSEAQEKTGSTTLASLTLKVLAK